MNKEVELFTDYKQETVKKFLTIGIITSIPLSFFSAIKFYDTPLLALVLALLAPAIFLIVIISRIRNIKPVKVNLEKNTITIGNYPEKHISEIRWGVCNYSGNALNPSNGMLKLELGFSKHQKTRVIFQKLFAKLAYEDIEILNYIVTRSSLPSTIGLSEQTTALLEREENFTAEEEKMIMKEVMEFTNQMKKSVKQYGATKEMMLFILKELKESEDIPFIRK